MTILSCTYDSVENVDEHIKKILCGCNGCECVMAETWNCVDENTVNVEGRRYGW